MRSKVTRSIRRDCQALVRRRASLALQAAGRRERRCSLGPAAEFAGREAALAG